MAKYDYLHSEVLKLFLEDKTLSSDRIAEIISKKDESVTNSASLARYIRRSGWLSKELREPKPPKPKPIKPNVKVLLFDIETAPVLAFTWSLYPNAIPTEMVHRDWFMFSWSAKWLFEDGVMSYVLTPEEATEGNDERIVRKLWDALNECDIAIGHNLDRFDVRKANARFLNYGLNLPSPYQTIDTLKAARKKFSLTSNRLDYIASVVLGIEGKMETPKGLWKKCYLGDSESLETMRLYCDKDVAVLEDVYLALRPYIQPHPNIGLLDTHNSTCCPSCGSHNLINTNTPYRTYVNEYESLRCGDCGSLSRVRKSSTPILSRSGLTVSLPK